MKVKTIRAHYYYGEHGGEDPHKKVGSVYEVPEGDERRLVQEKLVEIHSSEKK